MNTNKITLPGDKQFLEEHMLRDKKKLFNEWAATYNQDVKKTYVNNDYPFCGYKETLKLITDYVHENKLNTVVEMGIGTGVLSKQLYDKGHFIIGVDFSTKMIDHAFDLMPDAKFINTDFKSSVQYMNNDSIDCFIFSYAIHHLSAYKQYSLLRLLDYKLKKGGVIIIGDVMRKSPQELKQLEKRYKDIWDSDEHYPTLDDYKKNLYDIYKISYAETSHCAGVIVLEK